MTLGAFPESGRPSDSAATALGTSQLAWSGTPGLLVNANGHLHIDPRDDVRAGGRGARRDAGRVVAVRIHRVVRDSALRGRPARNLLRQLVADLTGVDHLLPGARAALHLQAAAQPRAHVEVHAVVDLRDVPVRRARRSGSCPPR